MGESLQLMVLEQLEIHIQKNKVGPSNQLKMDQKPKCKN